MALFGKKSEREKLRKLGLARLEKQVLEDERRAERQRRIDEAQEKSDKAKQDAEKIEKERRAERQRRIDEAQEKSDKAKQDAEKKERKRRAKEQKEIKVEEVKLERERKQQEKQFQEEQKRLDKQQKEAERAVQEEKKRIQARTQRGLKGKLGKIVEQRRKEFERKQQKNFEEQQKRLAIKRREAEKRVLEEQKKLEKIQAQAIKKDVAFDRLVEQRDKYAKSPYQKREYQRRINRLLEKTTKKKIPSLAEVMRMTRAKVKLKGRMRGVGRVPAKKPSLAGVMRRTREKLKIGGRMRDVGRARVARRAVTPAAPAKVKPAVGRPAAPAGAGDYRAKAREEARWRAREETGGLISKYTKARINFWVVIAIVLILAAIMLIKFWGSWYFILLVIVAMLLIYFILGQKAFAIASVVAIIIFLFIIPSIGVERVETVISPAGTWLKGIVGQKVSSIQRSMTGVGEWRNPYVTEAEEKKGVIIKEIITRKPYLPGEDISVIGIGVIKALENEAQVYFGCSIGDKKGVVKESDIVIDVVAGIDRPFSVECVVESDKSFERSESIKFSAIYTGFKTNGKLKLWTLLKSEKISLDEAGINPFDKYGEVYNSLTRFDKLLRVDKDTRVTTSSYSYGPLILSLSVPYPQPLVPGEYTLLVGVDNDKLGWGGEIAREEEAEHVGKVVFKLPDNIESECKEINLKAGKDSYTEDCKIVLSNVEEGLSFTQIEAELTYDYEFSKSKEIIISEA